MTSSFPSSSLRRVVTCTLAACLSLLALPPRLTAAEPVVLRTALVPDSPWVGQRVILRIEVLGQDAWAQVTRFGELEVPGAYIIRGSGSGSRLQETIDGQSYSGQRYEWSVYPQRAGTLEIPAIDVQVVRQGFGASDGKPSPAAMRTPPVRTDCRQPPGTETIRGLISTSQLTATQRWNPTPGEQLKVGDALKRVVELEASDVSGMAFTPSPPPVINGVGIYPAQPEVEDKSNRGTLTGKRIESVTYVFESPGEVQLPDRSIRWWNSSTESLEEVKLPGMTITVTGPAATTTTTPSSTAADTPRWWWIITGLATVTFLAAFACRHQIRRHWTSWQEQRQHSEAAYFRHLTHTIQTNSNADSLRELMRWIDTVSSEPAPARLDRFLDRYGDAESRTLTQQLSRPDSATVDAAALQRSITAARRRWIADRKNREQSRRASEVLPPLNSSS